MPRPTQSRRGAAVEAVIDRGRDRGVADAHLAEAQQVGAARDRLHAEGDGGRAAGLVHRGLARDVERRHFEREFEDLEPEAGLRADLVDGRAAGREIRHHGGRHRGRIGRHAARRHAVIAGKHRNERTVDRGLGRALDGAEPDRQVFQAAERARRLGKIEIARPYRLRGRFVEGGHLRHQGANVVER